MTSAQLWFYKEFDENDDLNQTFVLSELDHWDLDRHFEKNTVLAIFETDIGGGYSIFPLVSPASFLQRESCRADLIVSALSRRVLAYVCRKLKR